MKAQHNVSYKEVLQTVPMAKIMKKQPQRQPFSSHLIGLVSMVNLDQEDF